MGGKVKAGRTFGLPRQGNYSFSEIRTNIWSRAVMIFCDLSQWGAILYFATRLNLLYTVFAFEMASMAL